MAQFCPRQIDNVTAVAYANYGASSFPNTTAGSPNRGIGSQYRSTAVALGIAGKDNPVADASFCLAIKVAGGYPYPDRELRGRSRLQVEV